MVSRMLLLVCTLLIGVPMATGGSCYDSVEESETYGSTMCGGDGAATDEVTYYTTYSYQSSYSCTYSYTTYGTYQYSYQYSYQVID